MREVPPLSPPRGRACPRCGATLAAPLLSLFVVCGACGERFRSVAMAALMSVALPGAGHIFLGRRLLGSLELAGALVILGAALFNLGLIFMQVIRQEALPLDLLRPTLPWGLALVFYSIASGIFTWLFSRGRFVPAGRE